MTEEDVRERAIETKKRYQKYAELIAKKEKLDDYYLKIDREKKLLVGRCNISKQPSENRKRLRQVRPTSNILRKENDNEMITN